MQPHSLKQILKLLSPFKTGNLGKRFQGGENPREKIPREWGQEKILAHLLQKYGTNRKYTALFLDHMLRNHKDNPQFDLYVDAELGSLNRGREFIKSLCNHFGNPHLFCGKECLDIGSSAGNSLIAFVEYGASRATGIEVSPQRYQTAQVNIQGCSQEIRARVQMWQDDIQNDGIARLGQFDAIFCSDVLEHVPNPLQAIKQICGLLKNKPEAFAYVKLRNFQHPQNVLHEPHYDFPGMVLLPHDKAKQYYDLIRPDPELNYEVYHWMTLAEYQGLFHSFGKRCRHFSQINPDASSLIYIEDEGKRIPEAFNQFSISHRLDPVLEQEIREQIAIYLKGMQTRIGECQSTKDKQLLESFFLDYGIFDIIMLISNP